LVSGVRQKISSYKNAGSQYAKQISSSTLLCYRIARLETERTMLKKPKNHEFLHTNTYIQKNWSKIFPKNNALILAMLHVALLKNFPINKQKLLSHHIMASLFQVLIIPE